MRLLFVELLFAQEGLVHLDRGWKRAVEPGENSEGRGSVFVPPTDGDLDARGDNDIYRVEDIDEFGGEGDCREGDGEEPLDGAFESWGKRMGVMTGGRGRGRRSDRRNGSLEHDSLSLSLIYISTTRDQLVKKSLPGLCWSS